MQGERIQSTSDREAGHHAFIDESHRVDDAQPGVAVVDSVH